MKIKTGDNVIVISGKDRGRKGKVLKVLPKEDRLVVEGLNLAKKHIKPRRSGAKGQRVDLPMPFSTSNLKLICGKCNRGVRVGYVIEKGQKYRLCKKCGAKL